MSRDELSAGTVRKRATLAILLIPCAPVLFWWHHRDNGTLVMPTFVGISLILAAARLLDWNTARRELQQQQRIQAHLIRERDSPRIAPDSPSGSSTCRPSRIGTLAAIVPSR